MDKKDAITRLDALDKESQQLRRIINGDITIIEDINSYEDACKILSQNPISNAQPETQLKTIIKAINYIDNGNKIWIPNYKDNSEYKYEPYFEEKKGRGLVFNFSSYSCRGCGGSVSYKFKTRTGSDYAGKKFTKLFTEM